MTQDTPDGYIETQPAQEVNLVSGFGVPWYARYSDILGAGLYIDHTITINDSDFIYMIDNIMGASSAAVILAIQATFNLMGICAMAGTAYCYCPMRDNPSIQMIKDDSLVVRVTNGDTSTRTITSIITGTKFIRPPNFGHPPQCLWSATPLGGITPFNIQFTDASLYSPTAWKWYFDGVNLDSSSQNPLYAYTVGGVFSPKLRVENVYGYDIYVRANYITVAKAISPAGFTEVDATNRIIISGQSIQFAEIRTNESTYLYKDYGASFWDGYDIVIKVNPISADVGGVCGVFMLSNSVGDMNLGTGLKLMAFFYVVAGGVNRLYLRLMNNSVELQNSYNVYNAGVTSWIRIVHVAGSNTVTLTAYITSDLTSSYWTLSISDALLSTKFRYLYLASSYNLGVLTSYNAYSYDRGAVSPVV